MNWRCPASGDSTARRAARRLRWEISLLLTLKLVLLLIIKQLWFSDPVAPAMKVPPEKLARHFFSAAAIDVSPPPGVRHDRSR